MNCDSVSTNKMAPNANQSRLRNRIVNKLSEDSDDATMSTVLTKNLKDNEIAIDGIIYDLNGFKHPGGDSIHVFGGNDVTVQYKMIHPLHSKKQLKKMRTLGKVSDYKMEYLFDTEFEREIKREVYKIVGYGKDFGTTGYFARAMFYLALYFFLLYKICTTGLTWQLAFAHGVTQALIGLNVQHDANHGAASKKAWVNDLLGFGADMIGGCKWLWMTQHWTHHAFTNHDEKDPDSFNAEPMLLFNDYPHGHPKRKFYHAFQAVYFLPVLSFYWLSMVFNPQTIDLEHRGVKSVGMNVDNEFLRSRRKWAVLIRIVYVSFTILRPLQLAYASGLSIGMSVIRILSMGAIESLTLATLFSLSHNFEHVSTDPMKEMREDGKAVCWFKSQVETSSTYGSFIAGYLTGGLNFQVEHHLFPRMCSAHYPYIAPKVREICKKHGVQYIYYPWIWQNFIATVKFMNQAGTGSNWFDEDFLNPLKGDL